MPSAYRRKTGPKDDDSKPAVGRPRTESSEVTSDITSTGLATMAQIAGLFRTDAKTLPKRLRSLPSEGKNRNGYKVYNIRSAAALLVEPGYEIEEFIRQMSPQEMSPLLLKEFWNGQNARLKHERELGNLWPTEDVVEFVGELLATTRMTILLVTDDVDREESLTDGQRKVIRRIMDGLIDELRKKIGDKFKDFHANRSPTQAAAEDEDDALSAWDEDFEALSAGSEEVADEDFDEQLLAAEDDEEEDIGI